MNPIKIQQEHCHHLFVSGFGTMGDAVICCKCGVDKYPEAIQGLYDKAVAENRVFFEGGENYGFLASKALQAMSRARGEVQPM